MNVKDNNLLDLTELLIDVVSMEDDFVHELAKEKLAEYEETNLDDYLSTLVKEFRDEKKGDGIRVSAAQQLSKTLSRVWSSLEEGAKTSIGEALLETALLSPQPCW
ncbi:unnamed protein product [Microthlaspi erraticum]|uniref:Importin N-terminal domain-containing protein n=1 Tax=Microthlaspi erraticum TaxID=1685480 RepID=A0A6D2L727_9BRAS|nr:unnamed protein product [Microthlaspi erraticum]